MRPKDELLTRRHDGEPSGTSTASFIVMLPFLLMVMLASVEISRMIFSYHSAIQAASESARLGAVKNSAFYTLDQIYAAMRSRGCDVLGASGVGCTSSTVVPTCTGACQVGTYDGSQLCATVTINFSTIFPVFVPGLRSVPLSYTSCSRYES